MNTINKNETEPLKIIHKLFVNTDNRISSVWLRLKTFDKLFNLMIVINILLIACVGLLAYEISTIKGSI